MKWIVILLIVIVGVFSLGVYEADRDDKEWRDFAASHHCKAVPKTSAFDVQLWDCDGFQVKHP